METKMDAKIEHTVRCLEEELKSVSNKIPKWSIFRIPKRLRHVNPEAYTPHLISIGPLHHGNNSLSYMEKHKQNYLFALLSRTGSDYSKVLDACVRTMVGIESQADNCYAGHIPNDGLNLSKILITDSCFIIELFLRYYWEVVVGNKDDILRLSDCKLLSRPNNTTCMNDDPIFQSNWIISTLRRDLALLENQIPLFVLQELLNTLATVACCRNSLQNNLLAGLIFQFFKPDLCSNPERNREAAPSQQQHRHLLHLLHIFHLPAGNRRGQSGDSTGRKVKFIDTNVTNLIDVGMKLRVKQDSGLFNFNFDNNGVLEIPQLRIHEWSDSLFRNLMAFEHCFHGGGQFIASYINLMNCLIENKDDVKLLKGKQIITNELGGAEYMVDFFKEICEQVVIQDFYFHDSCEKINKYYQSRWRRYIHDLKKNYFATPWTTISLNVAALILCLATVQTV
ncbi:UPF0481 protein At3g47200-like isoform X2 [Chenopodium quinoa]|nr:UPF0481 protein At3g47200-like isoform X2 [Chenopodium quinoa]